MLIWIGLLLVTIAFCCEYMDSSLGMGYGVTLVPILLIMGYEPLQIIPTVLLSEFISGLLSAGLHHKVENVSFTDGNSLKVVIVLALLSIVGTTLAVFVAINIPKFYIKLWIGIIAISMGIIILATRNFVPKFSWTKISLLGSIAAFNKGMSGGGYGPIVMGGQILSGINVKNAIGITSFAEGIVCFVGVTLYLFLDCTVDWSLAPWIVSGAVLSVPFAVYTVKYISEFILKYVASILILILGILTIVKVLL